MKGRRKPPFFCGAPGRCRLRGNDGGKCYIVFDIVILEAAMDKLRSLAAPGRTAAGSLS
jgi:hypothetical protein